MILCAVPCQLLSDLSEMSKVHRYPFFYPIWDCVVHDKNILLEGAMQVIPSVLTIRLPLPLHNPYSPPSLPAVVLRSSPV
jgi:hypothetical protein